ncbi:MAG: hypothetical protein ACRBFS_00320 [Aureispira sp.]
MSSILDDAYSLEPQHNQAAYNTLQQVLPANQTLCWSAQPVQGILWNKGNGVSGCFGLLICLVFLPLLPSLLTSDLPWFIYCFIVPFLGFGIYLFFGHFLHNQWKRKHTFYGLTNNTIWIKKGKKVTPIPLSSEGHWQKYRQNNRHTWILRKTKDQYSTILVVLQDLPLSQGLEQELLALEQEVIIWTKRSS